MKKFFRAIAVLAAAMILSTSFTAVSFAETRVRRNKAEWVMEQQEAAAEAEKQAQIEATAAVEEAQLRQEIVDYALSFVGGRYVYGGTDPHSGVDCSGFTRYIYSKMTGINMTHSSREQATLGKTVSADEMKPGDLLFYNHGKGRVDHVAMYIGNGQIVHASTEKTGIKISQWNYNTPVRIASLL